MEHLYVCHFSNGHVKVGRSVDPISRIASHADRVACMGVQLVEKHVVECLANVIHAEANMIAACAEIASARNNNEWFVGLDYLTACEFANEFAAQVSAERETNDWCEFTRKIIASGYTQTRLAEIIGCAQPSIAKIVSGGTKEPSFSVGYGLLMIGRSIGIDGHSAIRSYGVDV